MVVLGDSYYAKSAVWPPKGGGPAGPRSYSARMAQTKRCPHCGNQNEPALSSGGQTETCIYCDERIQWTARDGWVVAPAGSYQPMTREQANEVVTRYEPGQYVSMGLPHTAELIEAYLVLGGASIASVHKMREQLLGAGAND